MYDVQPQYQLRDAAPEPQPAKPRIRWALVVAAAFIGILIGISH